MFNLLSRRAFSMSLLVIVTLANIIFWNTPVHAQNTYVDYVISGCNVQVTVHQPSPEFAYTIEIIGLNGILYNDIQFSQSGTDILWTYTFPIGQTSAVLNVFEGEGPSYLNEMITINCSAATTTSSTCGFPLTGKVVGAMVKTVNAYWAPSEDAETDIQIPAGKTFWVLEKSGNFYKIVIACKTVWVPVESMGPNFDEVWRGQALP